MVGCMVGCVLFERLGGFSAAEAFFVAVSLCLEDEGHLCCHQTVCILELFSKLCQRLCQRSSLCTHSPQTNPRRVSHCPPTPPSGGAASICVAQWPVDLCEERRWSESRVRVQSMGTVRMDERSLSSLLLRCAPLSSAELASLAGLAALRCAALASLRCAHLSFARRRSTMTWTSVSLRNSELRIAFAMRIVWSGEAAWIQTFPLIPRATS